MTDGTGSTPPGAGRPEDERDRAEVQQLIAFIRDTRGFDFGAYKHAPLVRRMRKRMHEVGASGYLDYRDLLESNSDEFGALFDTVFINVTEFFRDEPAWTYLQREIVPTIAARAGPSNEIRVWSAGCATGEEAYTLAIVFAEVLGVPGCVERVKIYGTDVDEPALRVARAGAYSPEAVESVPADLRERYFDADRGRFTFRADLRHRVIFGHHDITRDAPISHLDLLVCRNTLMYFNVETQSHAIDRFHFALRDNGFLFLGRAEMLVTDGQRFEVVSTRQRVFRRRGAEPALRYRPAAVPEPDRWPVPQVRGTGDADEARNLVVDGMPLGVIVVDADGMVALVNGRARALFGLTANDLGRPFHDLEVSYRPAELRSPIQQARVDRRPVRLDGVERRTGPEEELQYLDMMVAPLLTGGGRVVGTALYFADATTAVRLRQEVQRTREDLITAYEELQSTNEELETTNEELQSSIEELETTNEELQSTNEELETTNQELHANNDELERTSDEVRARSTQLDTAQKVLEGVLSSLTTGVAVLDREKTVRTWNRAAEDVCGVSAQRAQGQALGRLPLRMPVGELEEIVGECLSSGQRTQPRSFSAADATGRLRSWSVVCAPLGVDGAGVVLLIDRTADA